MKWRQYSKDKKRRIKNWLGESIPNSQCTRLSTLPVLYLLAIAWTSLQSRLFSGEKMKSSATEQVKLDDSGSIKIFWKSFKPSIKDRFSFSELDNKKNDCASVGFGSFIVDHWLRIPPQYSYMTVNLMLRVSFMFLLLSLSQSKYLSIYMFVDERGLSACSVYNLI